MLDVKKLLTKMIANGCFNNSSVNATKTNSTAWTGGTITCFRKGHCCTVKFNGVAHPKITSRTTIGTIPSGYRPPNEVEAIMTNVTSVGEVNSAVKFLVETNGDIRIDPTNANTVWATLTYCV